MPWNLRFSNLTISAQANRRDVVKPWTATPLTSQRTPARYADATHSQDDIANDQAVARVARNDPGYNQDNNNC